MQHQLIETISFIVLPLFTKGGFRTYQSQVTISGAFCCCFDYRHALLKVVEARSAFHVKQNRIYFT